MRAREPDIDGYVERDGVKVSYEVFGDGGPTVLLHFDGQTYHMGDFVVMPNHVHLLFCLFADADILSLGRSWKQFTATRINRALGRRGRFWQEEGFDHLVRSTDQFERMRRYIAENPVKANLKDGEFLYYRRPEPPES